MRQIIADEIHIAGGIPFARFMELALYCPVYGYYEKEKDNVGRAGDFFTNVSVGGLFGELLAFQFSEWLEQLSSTAGPLRIVEAGAHDARLARDILTWIEKSRAELFRRLTYIIMEPSPRRREWQQKTLSEFSGNVLWVNQPSDVGESDGGVRGIIFSNELLDAMPARRIGWDAGNQTWFEWGVGMQEDRFVWKRLLNADQIQLPDWPGELLAVLPDEFTTESSPAATNWWREAARVLRQGRLMTIDYGLSAEEFISPARTNGTLRTYSRHRSGEDLLENVGEQDITAHVNFTGIQAAGESMGLTTNSFVSQEKFLMRIVEQVEKHPESFGEWTPVRTRQLKTLTHPEHLGRPFRVLIQSRQVGSDNS